MDQQDFIKGRLNRFFKLGSLSGIIGASYFGHKAKSMFSSPDKVADSLYQTNVKNAERIAKTFGQLKGAVMKVGQMMSLQAGLLPQEFTSVLSSLQQDSAPVNFSLLEGQVTSELGAPLGDLFSSFDPQAYASASIGQVHRAVLPEGREVVIKIQYPGVGAMVESDLKNLRMVFRSLAKLKLDMDFLELWAEVRERLHEELNYEQEYRNMVEFRTLFQDDPRIIIPEPIPEYTTRHVLTMEYVAGLRWQNIVDAQFPSEKRNQLALLLFDTLLRQLFQFHLLHADPNLSNFAFREDGKLIIYDFGCVKRFTPEFITCYASIIKNALSNDFLGVRQGLKNLGFGWKPENAIADQFIQEVARIALKPYLVEQNYDFGTATLHDELFFFARNLITDDVKFVIPPDLIFLDRVVGGMYGNMIQLRASGDWKKILWNYLEPNGQEPLI